MGERVVITGGAGFLGSHRCEWLLADGCVVAAAASHGDGLAGEGLAEERRDGARAEIPGR